MRFFNPLRRLIDNGSSSGVDFMKILKSITSNIDLELLLGDLVPRLMDYTRSVCGAFYLANNAANKLEIKYSTGFSRNIYTEFDLAIGEGLIGTAAEKEDVTIISDIPEDSVFVTKTFLGKLKPKNIMFVPVICNGQLMGVLALASLYRYKKNHINIINLSKYYVGASISNSVIYGRSKRLTNELQFQNKLIADLNNDLEVKLAERSKSLSLVLDGIEGCAVYAADKNGAVLFWNSEAGQLFGFTAAEAIGEGIVSLLSGGSNAKAALIQFKMDHALKHGAYREGGMRKKTNGTYCYTESYLTPVYDGNTEYVMVFVSREINKPD